MNEEQLQVNQSEIYEKEEYAKLQFDPKWTHYEILGITANADQALIAAAYRLLRKKYHPDKFAISAEDQLKATQLFQRIGEANTVLSNPESKRTYDRELVVLEQLKGVAADSRTIQFPKPMMGRTREIFVPSTEKKDDQEKANKIKRLELNLGFAGSIEEIRKILTELSHLDHTFAYTDRNMPASRNWDPKVGFSNAVISAKEVLLRINDVVLNVTAEPDTYEQKLQQVPEIGTLRLTVDAHLSLLKRRRW